MKGLTPLAFSLFFVTTALAQVLPVLNARLTGRFRPQTPIRVGVSASTVAVAALPT